MLLRRVEAMKLAAQVRDFDFSPDDGRIARLVIDALGIPALPIKLLGCSAVRIQLVQNITWNCITLAPGSEAYIDKLTTGLFDDAVNILRVSRGSHCCGFACCDCKEHSQGGFSASMPLWYAMCCDAVCSQLCFFCISLHELDASQARHSKS